MQIIFHFWQIHLDMNGYGNILVALNRLKAFEQKLNAHLIFECHT